MLESQYEIMIAAMVLLVVMSGFFSASETAFSSLNMIRLKTKAEDGDKKAQRIIAMAEKYDDLLSTILIGNNIVNIALASLGTVFFSALLTSGAGPTVSTIVITVVVLIFGEVTPKSMAKQMPERFAGFCVPVLSVLMFLFTPLNVVLKGIKTVVAKPFKLSAEEGITDAELITMVEEAEDGGDLTAHESELIRNAIEFDDVEVEEILTPRVDVVAVEDTCSMKLLEETFIESNFSRIPVYHKSIDNIIGVIHEKDYFSALRRGVESISDLIEPTQYTTGSVKIGALLRTLKDNHDHLAVVLDEYGGTEGIVTMEDILEELVGEIWDEHDEETSDFTECEDGSWLVLGSASVNDLYEELDIPEDPEVDSNSVSGLVQEKMPTLPKVGDRFTVGNYEGVVTRVSRRRVLQVRMKEIPGQGDKE
ncbi:MAG: hemolysin family protein [Lachnospiraceae bacterium]|nr:hemolysin family protein [Lachnospiraceae bacterium]